MTTKPAPPPDRQGPALNPVTHFVLMPVFTVGLGIAIYLLAHRRTENPALYVWLFIISMGLVALNLQTRLYALRVQDRLIRLEERLRLASLLPVAEHASIAQLTTPQLIALRFASDAELPSLARQAIHEAMAPAAIKSEIIQWRLDDARI